MKGRRGPNKRAGGAPAPPPVGADTSLDELVERVRRESPLKHEAAKELGVRVLRGLLVEQARLEALSRGGSMTGDEAKAMSANASNIRRWYEALGVVQHRDPEDEGAL